MYDYLTLKEIQNEELQILKKIIKFLEENDIKYFVMYGTLLGAIRHKGFIPWDDDIDIAILRPDYEKLIKLLKDRNNVIENEFQAIGFELENSDQPFIKAVNKNIEVIDKNNCDQNLWIDIFPLDIVEENSNKFFERVFRLRNLYWFKRSEYRGYRYCENNKIKEFVEKILKFIFKPLKFEKFVEYYIDYCKKYENKNTNFIANPIWGAYVNIFPKKMFEETAKYQFEDIEVIGPKDYDLFLKTCYGDYMKLPPEDKRINHTIKVRRTEENDEK